MDAQKIGKLERLSNGSDQVSFSRASDHSISKVWAYITEPEELMKWFPGLKLECRTGGTFEIWFSDKCEGPAHVNGTVTRFEPPNTKEESTNTGSDAAVWLLEI